MKQGSFVSSPVSYRLFSLLKGNADAEDFWIIFFGHNTETAVMSAWETSNDTPSFIILSSVCVRGRERWTNTDFLHIYGQHLPNTRLSQDTRYHLEKHRVVWFFHLLWICPGLCLNRAVLHHGTHHAAMILLWHLCTFNIINISIFLVGWGALGIFFSLKELWGNLVFSIVNKPFLPLIKRDNVLVVA